jgi:cytoskeletal protein CcmA (bactofilin family)
MSDNCAYTSLIGVGAVVAGDLLIAGRFHVDGTINGAVRVLDGQEAILIIGKTGRVDGAIEVPHLVIHGKTKGAITATEFIEITSTAQISGDVEYNSVRIHSGAVIHGHLLYREKSATPLVRLPTKKA